MLVWLLALRLAAPCLGQVAVPPDSVLEPALIGSGHTLAWFKALDPAAQEKVVEELFPPARKGGRVLSLSMRAPVPQSLKDINASLDSPEAERLRLDSTFDGSARPAPAAGIPAWDGLEHGLQIQNGQVKRFSLRDPSRDLELSVGQLGIVSRNPLIGQSMYGNIYKGWETDGRVDGSLKLQAGLVGLNARLFYDDNPALDKKVDDAVDAAQSVAVPLGLATPSQFDTVRKELQVGTSFSQAPIFVGSALGQLGKTFRAVGPLDAGIVGGLLAGVTDMFPSAVADEAFALRLHAPGGISVAAFAGASEAVNLIRQDVWSEAFQKFTIPIHAHLELAPHAGAEVWGPIPRLAGSNFSLGTSYLFAPTTDRVEVHGSAYAPVRSGGVEVAGRYMQETGQEIEYSRRQAGAELGVYPSKNLEVYGQYVYEDAQFGNVGMKNQAGIVGLRGRDDTGPYPQTLAIEQVFGGQDQMILPASTTADILSQIAALGDLLSALSGSQGSSVTPGLRTAWGTLDSSMKTLLLGEAGAASGSGGVSGIDDQTLATIIKLATTLVDPAVYERIVIRYMRYRILLAMQTKQIPFLGGHIQLSAPVVIALAHAYSNELSPIPPVTEDAVKESIDPFLFNELKKQTGLCGSAKTEDDFTNCVLGMIPSGSKYQGVAGPVLSDILKQSIQWGAELVRQELNREILSVVLAAEALNEITVSKGIKLHELNQQWLAQRFKKMDQGERRPLTLVLKNARRDLEAEVAQQEKVLKLKLVSYGMDKLDGLRAEKGWGSGDVQVPNKDWAPLVAFYGDGPLFDFISKAKAALPAGRVLKISFTPYADMGVVVSSGQDAVSIQLPPLSSNQPPEAALKDALEELGSPR